jgi:hypothetical protein
MHQRNELITYGCEVIRCLECFGSPQSCNVEHFLRLAGLTSDVVGAALPFGNHKPANLLERRCPKR